VAADGTLRLVREILPVEGSLAWTAWFTGTFNRGAGHLHLERVPVVAAFRLLLAVAYWGLLMPTVVPVSIWLPVPSGLSACYCLDRPCVPKSLATPR
jgi:hypothetical protein